MTTIRVQVGTVAMFDPGVFDVTKERFMLRVAAGEPALGQYIFGEGAYLFNAADGTHAMRLAAEDAKTFKPIDRELQRLWDSYPGQPF